MTDIIQVVDRHIGVIYKKAVYMAVRKELMRQLQWAQQEAGRADGVTIPPLAPCEKCINITKAIPDCHERLINSNAYERAFITTATWMPISHLVREKNGACNMPLTVPEELQVDLQYLPEYNYLEQCSKEKVFGVIDAIKLKEEEERVEKE